ncbi:MAG: hypothetical protein IJM22_04815 [Treponema sp.]|nr:hypothetical protein [Treponema sp.]
MITLKHSGKKKAALSLFTALTALAVFSLCCILSKEDHSMWSLIIGSLTLIIGFVNVLNINQSYFSYDDEKMIFRSLFKAETVYFKDILFFGTGKSNPIMGSGKAGGTAASGNGGRISYYLVKTKAKNYQPDIPLNQDNSELIKADLTEKIRTTNPRAVIKF